MLTAMLAARNLMGESHDVWNVNVERSYHEDFVAKPITDKGAADHASAPAPGRAVSVKVATPFGGSTSRKDIPDHDGALAGASPTRARAALEARA